MATNDPTSLRRMWFNQPSTLQPLHRMHGMRVLACPHTEKTMRVYLLSGDTISMQVPRETLSEGWPESDRSTSSVVLVGQACPQHGMIEKDDFLHWRMNVREPYPHVVQFGIVPDVGSGPAPLLHEVEQADEVRIEFDLSSRTETFDGMFPALETSLDRIAITRHGSSDADQG